MHVDLCIQLYVLKNKKDAMAGNQTSWFLTAPEISTRRRRGDPLGLRNLTDEVAELLAPGVTNRTRDARWLTLLSWSLVESDRAWRKARNGHEQRADDGAQRYDWLRPLELLWVARSIHLGGDQYRAVQWPGYRSVRRWNQPDPNFSMTPRQLKNHRQLGAYGAYRVLFRQEGFTVRNDGWTPAEAARKLGQYVSDTLQNEGSPSSWTNKPQTDDPAHWWINKGWKSWKGTGSGSKLLLSTATPVPLHDQEVVVLRPLLFPSGSDRLRTATAIGSCSNAKDYVVLCHALAKKLPRSGGDPRLASLGTLAALHDAALGLLRTIALCVNDGIDTLSRLTRNQDVKDAINSFATAATAWRERPPAAVQFEYAAEASRLAELEARSSSAFLVGFINHHQQCGSGVRWFVRSGEKVVSMGAESGINSGGFGYRLHALARLAIQCRVIDTLPVALTSSANDDNSEDE